VPIYPLPAETKRQPAGANWRDAEGNYYEQHCGGHLNIHGFGWPSTMVAAEVGLRKYAADGETLLFDVGNKAVTWPGTHPEGPDEVSGDAKAKFAVRLAGSIEPKLSDTYTFFIYGGPADVWIDGRHVLDASTPAAFKSGERYRSQSIRLTAGRKVPIRIEARRTAEQALYLSWEAEALTAEVVPGRLLYPER